MRQLADGWGNCCGIRMYMLYFYKLIAPYKQIGICGDSDDTGEFYLIIFHDKEQLLYWDITEAGILQQIINDDFEIEWFA